MTAGEYLKSLLKQKSVSVSELASRLGLASRNELYRLFGGNQSFEKSRELIDATVKLVPFSEPEISKLYTLLDEFRGGRYAEDVKRILSNAFAPRTEGLALKQENLSDALNRHKGKKIFIMSGIRSEKIIQDIYAYMKRRQSAVTYHYMRFPRADTLTAYEILALMRLSEFPNYIPLENGRSVPDGLYILTKSADGCWLQLLEYEDDEQIFLETLITGASYNYIIEKNERIQNECLKIKKNIVQLHSYAEMFEETRDIDTGDSIYCEGAPCFGYLPIELLREMFQGVNFFGYPEEHPYVRQIINVVQERNDNLYAAGRKRVLFDERHIKRMMQTGLAIDHVNEFPPMTSEQLSRYFDRLEEYLSREERNTDCRILKNADVKYPFVYTKNQMLYMYRSNTKQKNMDAAVIILRKRSVNETMNYFADYMWEQCTLPAEETIDALSKMREKYLGI